MLIVDLANQKGGVGKTTTTVNLARAAHLAGLTTLVVDLDPQANTTAVLLGHVPAGVATLADVLSARSDATAAEVIVETGWDGVEVLPSGGDTLADVGAELVTMGPGREHRLRQALERLTADVDPGQKPYDLVLLDSPPALDQLTINGLTAAHRVLIVTAAAQFSANGIARLLRTMTAVQEFTNPGLTVAGIVVNAWERQTARGKHWMEELRTKAPAEVWEPPIPKATWIGGAIEAGIGLDEWDTPASAVVAETYAGYLRRLMA